MLSNASDILCLIYEFTIVPVLSGTVTVLILLFTVRVPFVGGMRRPLQFYSSDLCLIISDANEFGASFLILFASYIRKQFADVDIALFSSYATITILFIKIRFII